MDDVISKLLGPEVCQAEDSLKPVYYNANGVLGTGALWYIVFSDRSDGKTFNIKERALRRFYQRGGVTVYVRRWKTEFNATVQNEFFDEIFEKKPELKPRGNFKLLCDKQGVQIHQNGKTQRIIYYVPLSIAGRLKSTFNPTHIEEIDFDEYFPLDGRYIKDEMIQLMELWNTCDRKRNSVKLGIFGNRIEASAPCLKFFGINKDLTKPGIKVYKKGALAVQSYSNKTNQQIMKEGPFWNLIEGTSYEEYMSGGILKTGQIKIADIPKDAKCWSGFKTKYGTGSLWSYFDNSLGCELMYVSDRQNTNSIVITDDLYPDAGINQFFTCMRGEIPKYFKELYYQNRFRMCKQSVWQSFKPILEKVVGVTSL